MKTYEFSIGELVKVWVRQTVEIEANSIDEIMEHIASGDLFAHYDVNFGAYETIDDTMEHIEFDYEMIDQENIKEA
jgi:hypothetical protein